MTRQRHRILTALLGTTEALTVQQVVELTGLPVSTVGACLRKLEDIGWLTRECPDWGRPFQYKIEDQRRAIIRADMNSR